MTLTEAHILAFEQFRQEVSSHSSTLPVEPGAVQNVLTGVAPGTNEREHDD